MLRHSTTAHSHAADTLRFAIANSRTVSAAYSSTLRGTSSYGLSSSSTHSRSLPSGSALQSLSVLRREIKKLQAHINATRMALIHAKVKFQDSGKKERYLKMYGLEWRKNGELVILTDDERGFSPPPAHTHSAAASTAASKGGAHSRSTTVPILTRPPPISQLETLPSTAAHRVFHSSVLSPDMMEGVGVGDVLKQRIEEEQDKEDQPTKT